MATAAYLPSWDLSREVDRVHAAEELGSRVARWRAGAIQCTIKTVDTNVRVWLADRSDRAADLSIALRGLGLDVDSDTDWNESRTEARVARWADVIVLLTESDSLDPQAAFLAGLAAGAQRPLLFIGPVPVRVPALAGLGHTLLEPVAPEAIAFQIRVLGAKTASRRERQRKNRPAKNHSGEARYANATDHTYKKSESIAKLRREGIDRNVFNALAHDVGVSSLTGDAWESKYLTSGSDARIDVLAWVEGAMPFNPVPIEIKHRATPGAIDQAFAILRASDAKIGALIVEEPLDSDGPVVEEREGKTLVILAAQVIAEHGAVFSRAIRAVRNSLVHGTNTRG